MTRYSIEETREHILLNHPGCPPLAVEYFAAAVADREWRDASLGKAVGITIHNILRHEMTDYDHLLRVGVGHEHARRRARARIQRVIALWSTPPETELPQSEA
ncbi:MAG: DUF2293 domain-containing protein [Rhizobium sp.]|nr:DUF2293 domain-containing protein [Rhizobium sp.]MDM8014216.1 DUF2293 domain-containing protein [Rhizobium sp.]